ncbi:MAG: cysteine desulfurase [Anaerolineales bacterium]
MDSGPKTKSLDVVHIRGDFPVLQRETRPGVPLVYLDNAATSQKPVQVIEAMDTYYREYNSNVHRGIHTLSEQATLAYEGARRRVAEFIGAGSWQEIVFTRNTTEAINLIAYSWGRSSLQAGDRILLTELEHHANIVPWQILAGERGIVLDFAPVADDGTLDMAAFEKLLKREPKLVSFAHVSNVLGTINPAKAMSELAHGAGALVAIDAAQSVPHMKVDVSELNADFFAFSSHKMLGPTGIGVLYARKRLLETMPPFMGGGDMIRRVEKSGFVANEVPYKFEAGTPAIAEAIGFGAAVDYLEALGMDKVQAHEQELVTYAMERLEEVPGLTLYGPPADMRGGVTSFTLQDAHPHDVAQILDEYGVAVRAGHHCAMPIHERFGLPATTRASYYIYNTAEEVDKLIGALYKVKELFS